MPYKNIEQKRAEARKYYWKHKERINARERAERIANPEGVRAYARMYYAATADQRREALRLIARNSYYRARALGKARKIDNDAARVRNMKRRAITRRSGEPITKDFLKFLMLAQKGRCAACSRDIKRKHHVDHITALSRGGWHERGNIQLLCPPCNFFKQSKDPIEWRQSLSFLL